jgi:hypothetical protein
VARGLGGAVRSAVESNVVALTPPYGAVTPLASLRAGASLPLGTVVVGVSDTTLASLAALTELTHSSPWAIPCLALPAKQEWLEPLLMLVTELRDRLVVVDKSAGLASRLDLRVVVARVVSRPLPTPTSLARWVAERLKDPDVQQPLRSQFEAALESTGAPEDHSVTTYSRLFQSYGPYSPRYWRAIARLCWYAHARAGRTDEHRGEHLALRTAIKHTRKYLQLPHVALGERLGWEWILEAALRTARYV